MTDKTPIEQPVDVAMMGLWRKMRSE